MRQFLVLGHHGPKVKKKADKWECIYGPTEDRRATYDFFFDKVEKGGGGLQEIQLISTIEGVERRNFFDT